MGTYDYRARPRYYQLDADYRLEVDYVAADAVTGVPAHIAPLDVVDYDDASADAETLFELASELRGYDGENANEVVSGIEREIERRIEETRAAMRADATEHDAFELGVACGHVGALTELRRWITAAVFGGEVDFAAARADSAPDTRRPGDPDAPPRRREAAGE